MKTLDLCPLFMGMFIDWIRKECKKNISKGGMNTRPTTPRPDIPPKPGRPTAPPNRTVWE